MESSGEKSKIMDNLYLMASYIPVGVATRTAVCAGVGTAGGLVFKGVSPFSGFLYLSMWYLFSRAMESLLSHQQSSEAKPKNGGKKLEAEGSAKSSEESHQGVSRSEESHAEVVESHPEQNGADSHKKAEESTWKVKTIPHAVAIPIAYIATSLVMRGLSVTGTASLTLFALPLLALGGVETIYNQVKLLAVCLNLMRQGADKKILFNKLKDNLLATDYGRASDCVQHFFVRLNKQLQEITDDYSKENFLQTVTVKVVEKKD